MTAHRSVVATGEGPAELRDLTDADLPDGDVTVEVAYSSLNYKDGLAVTGRAKIARRFPMVCGIDLAGRVMASDHPDWAPGDEVIVTGWGLSETHPGGYTTQQRVRSDWLVRMPHGLDAPRAMAIGTAGLTAMLCILALEGAGVDLTGAGEVLVTGAAGGVGSVAVAILSRLGATVAASTGRPEQADYLHRLGATTIVERSELAKEGTRPLESERWAAAIDTVGSTTLATALRQTRYRGAVAACGLAGGSDLPITVLPFILRNVALLGVDSVQCPVPVRAEAWRRLTSDLPIELLDAMTEVAPMSRISELAEAILAGETRGRTVIDVTA